MKNLHRLVLGCLALSLACFCPVECLHGQTWDELANGGADAGDFPQTDFQMGDGGVYDVIEGTLDPNAGDEFDSYLITVNDPANFTACTTVGFSEDDTRLWMWNTDGTLLMANDDDPDLAPPWFAKITDPSIWHGQAIDNPGSTVAGTDYVLTMGGFNSDPLDINGVDLANMVFDNVQNVALVGINPASTGDFATWDYFTNAVGGEYQIVMTGATLAGGGGGCTPGDVNMDGAIDLLDVAPFVDKLVTGTFCCEADINADGVVDLLDVTPFVELLTGG